MIKFTIGIPAFKSLFLRECIDSIIAQTYRNFELIIVNDKSPENIDLIVNDYQDERIHYYKNEKNTGAEHVVDNWNKCLSYAKGEYFILMGDDDKMETNYLEEFNRLINQHPNLGVYHCRVKVINENSDFLQLTEARPEFESVYSMIWYRMNGRLQYISDFAYRTDILKNNGGFYKLPLAWASDDISAYIAAQETGIANTNKYVFNYRENRSTITSTGNINLKLYAIQSEQDWIENFLETHTPRNEEEEFLAIMIRNRLYKHFIKKKVLTISLFFNKSGVLKGLIWSLKHKSNHKLQITIILYALFESFKNRKHIYIF